MKQASKQEIEDRIKELKRIASNWIYKYAEPKDELVILESKNLEGSEKRIKK